MCKYSHIRFFLHGRSSITRKFNFVIWLSISMQAPTDYAISRRFRKARLTANLTQQQLAEKLLVTPRLIGEIERCERDPTIKLTLNWAYETKVPFEYLVLGRIPLTQALEQIRHIRKLQNESVHRAYKLSNKLFDDLEQSYIDAWGAEFESYDGK